MDQLTQLMVITMEECGELIQACSKVLRGRDSMGSISDKNRIELQKEMADVRCMMDLMYKFGLLDHDETNEGILAKREKLKKWSNLIDDVH